MKKYLIVPLLSLFILAACGQAVEPSSTTSDESKKARDENFPSVDIDETDSSAQENSEIVVTSPLSDATVSSPLVVKGKALGNWFFEGVLPVSMEDENGNLLSAAPARALSDWMTEDFVEFEATLTFDPADNQTAVIVIKNDNPSGLPENSKKVEVPVNLAPAGEAPDSDEAPSTAETAGTDTVYIFYPNSKSDPEMMDCERVRSVKRTMPTADANATTALNLLLQGPSAEEKEEGFFTFIPENAALNGLKIENGTAYADFATGLDRGVAGSCTVLGIRAQIEGTLRQFDTVKNVVISVEGRTEDILQP